MNADAARNLYALLEQDTFLSGVRKFLENRYCISYPDTERLSYDCHQPSRQDSSDVIFLRLLYNDHDEDQEYEVIYYGPADGSGKFRDALVHSEGCCGASCSYYQCPLFESSVTDDDNETETTYSEE